MAEGINVRYSGPLQELRAAMGKALLAVSLTGVAAAQTPSLPEALDAPGLALSAADFNGAVSWRAAATTMARDGVDCAVSDAGAGPGSGALLLTIDGPAAVTFDWRVTGTDTGYAKVALRQEGNAFERTLLTIAGGTDWRTERVLVPPGRWQVAWSHARSHHGVDGWSTAWVDRLSVGPAPEIVPFGEGLGNPDIVWTAHGQGRIHGVVTDAGRHGVFSPADSSSSASATLPSGYFQISHREGGVSVEGMTAGEFLERDSGRQLTSGFLTNPRTVRISASSGTILFERLLTGSALTLAGALDTPDHAWQATGKVYPVAAADAWDGTDLVKLAGGSLALQTPGPLRIRFRWRGTLQFHDQGIELSRFSHPAPEGWSEREMLVGAGGQATISGHGEVDAVIVTPVTGGLSPETATGSTGVAWTLDAGWTGETDAGRSRDGVDLLRGRMAAAGQTAAQADFSGAGTLEFFWRRTGAAPLAGNLSATLDGTAQLLAAQSSWERVRMECGAGAHQLRWVLGPGAGLCGEIDSVRWQPGVAEIGQAADSPAGKWAVQGDWSVTTADAREGPSAIASPSLPSGGKAVIQFHGAEPGTVSFWWKSASGVSVIASDSTRICTLTGSSSLPGTDGWHQARLDSLSVWTLTAAEPLAAGALLIDGVRLEPKKQLVPGLGTIVGIPGVDFTTEGGLAEASTAAEGQDGTPGIRWTGNTAASTALGLTFPDAFELTFWYKSTGSFTLPAPDGLQVPFSSGGQWRRALVTRTAPGPHTIWLNRTGTGTVQLDNMTLAVPGTAGTFTGSIGAPPDTSVIIPNLGTGHDFADAAVAFDATPSVRLGPEASFVHGTVTGASLRWSLRHDERFLTPEYGGPPDTWNPVRAAMPLPTGATGRFRWIDGAFVVPLNPVLPVGDVLSSPELSWTLSPPGAWLQNGPGTMRAAAAPADTWMETQVTGPGVFHAAAVANVTVQLDGVTVPAASLPFFDVPAGSHTVRFTATAGLSASVVGPAVFAPSATAENALDLETMPGVTLSSLSPGFAGIAQQILCPDDADALLTPPLTSAATVTLSIPGPAQFRFRTLLYNGATAPSVSVNGAAQGAVSHVILREAANTVVLTFPAGGRRAMLDLLSVHPETAVPATDAGTAIDAPAWAWVTGSAWPWASQASGTGGSMALSPWVPSGTSAWMEAPLTGTGLLLASGTVQTRGGSGTLSVRYGTLSASLTGTDHVMRATASGTVLRVTAASTGTPGAGDVRATADALLWMADADAGTPLDTAVPIPGLTWGTPPAPGSVRAFPSPGGPAIVMSGAAGTTTALPFTAAGPGLLKWRHYKTESSGTFPLETQSGTQLRTSSTAATWRDTEQFLFPGHLQAVLKLVNSSGPLVLRSVSFTPAPLVDIAEALDTPGRTWTTGGDAPWTGLRRGGTAPNDELCTGALGHSQSAWVETVVDLPATVSWSGMIGAETGDRMTMSVNGAVQVTVTPSSTTGSLFTGTRRLTGTGQAAVRWTYAKNASVSSGIDTLCLDSIVIRSDATTGWQVALDTPAGVSVTQGSNAAIPLVPQSAPRTPLEGGSYLSLSGPSPLVSPPVPNLSWIDVTATGPAVLTYAHTGIAGGKQSDVPVDTWLGTSGVWQRRGIVLDGAAAQTMRIECQVPADLDALQRHPARAPSFLNRPGIVWDALSGAWTAFGEGAWQGIVSTAAAGVAVEATVTGPATLRFTAAGAGAMHANGVLVGNVTSPADVTFLVPSGTHRIRLANADGMRFWATGIQFTPPLYPGTFLEDPPVVLTAWAPAASLSTTNPLIPGQPYYPSSPLTTPSSMLTALLPNAGSLDYWTLTDGKWTAVTATRLPDRAAASMPGPIGALRWTPDVPLAAADAVESAGCVQWTSTGTWLPRRDATRSFDGSDSMAAVPGLGETVSSATGTIIGPVTLVFSWTGNATLAVGGTVLARHKILEGITAQPWRTRRLDLGAGTHTLTWTGEAGAALDAFSCRTDGTLLEAMPGVIAASSPEGLLRFVSATDRRLTTAAFPPGDTPAGTPLEVLVHGPALVAPAPVEQTSSLAISGREYAPGPRSTVTYGILPEGPFRITAEPLQTVAVSSLFGPSVTHTGGWQGFRTADGSVRFAAVPVVPNGPAISLQTSVVGPGFYSVQWSGHPLSATVNDLFSGDFWLPDTQPTRIRWLNETAVETATHAILTNPGLQPYHPQDTLIGWLAAAGLLASGPEGDPDGDGFTNLYEYAFGGDPLARDRPEITPVTVLSGGSLYPAVEFLGRQEGYVLENYGSQGWQALPARQVILSGPASLRRMRIVAHEPLGSAPVMLRVRW